jgi:hypothetical protein
MRTSLEKKQDNTVSLKPTDHNRTYFILRLELYYEERNIKARKRLT